MSLVLEVRPVVQQEIRGLCRRPYPGHPKGCPNYGRKKGCPPEAPMYDEVYNLAKPVYAIVTEFDLAGHVRRMREKHPDWSQAQLRCCLYWQPRARANLRLAAVTFMLSRGSEGYRAEMVPEAMGVNVTETLGNAGVLLEWPPVYFARQVALAAIPREEG